MVAFVIPPFHHENLLRGPRPGNIDGHVYWRVVRRDRDDSARDRRNGPSFSVLDPKRKLGDRRLAGIVNLVVVTDAIRCRSATTPTRDDYGATAATSDGLSFLASL
jgi:hypothetical protein